MAAGPSADAEPRIDGSDSVKTMNCRQLGGPCDHEHQGEDANHVIKAQDQHLREAVAAGQFDHEPALKAMKGRWKRPLAGMKWYRQAQRDFASLPDDRTD